MTKKPEVIKFRNQHGNFELNNRALRQTLPEATAGGIWREASRNSLKRFFTKQAAAGRKRIGGMTWGKYETWPKYRRMWGVSLTLDGPKRLSVGCITFTPLQTQIIRKWALAL